MRYFSVCSGIEAATVAWEPLGWEPAAFCEIEKFPSAVLAHHYPEVPNLGDMTQITDEQIQRSGAAHILVGGTPCQSFSIAGLRGGLDDARGNLALEYLRLADRLNPDWIVWENVPGVLSSNEGRDFGAFLAGLAECGYGWAYRVLDAQYFGVAQRRRRVFVVGHIGGWRSAAAVLFDRESLRRNPAPSRKEGQGSAGEVAHSLRGRGFDASEDGTGRGTPIVPCDSVAIRGREGGATAELGGDCAHALRGGDGNGSKAHVLAPAISHAIVASNGQRSDPSMQTYLPVCAKIRGGCETYVDKRDGKTKTAGKGALVSEDKTFTIAAVQDQVLFVNSRQDPCVSENRAEPMGAQDNGGAVCIRTANTSANGHGVAEEKAHTLDQAQGQAVATGYAVRRLTPVECERLQGFPDGYTQIPWRKKGAEHCPDGPRYKSLGNSMAVPVMRWIGERIQAVQDILDAGEGGR